MNGEVPTWPMSEWHRCGRPTKKGKPCGQRRYKEAAACNRHVTDEDRAETRQKWQKVHEETMEAIRTWVPDIQTTPVCWHWPVTDADRNGAMYHWQAGRCAICGTSSQVLDHDHDTGWKRGYLCRSCNTNEAFSPGRLFERYRKWNPARILGIWERYDGWYGPDRGRWNGVELREAVPVSSDGEVLFVGPSADSDDRLTAFLSARIDKLAAELRDKQRTSPAGRREDTGHSLRRGGGR